MTQPSQPPQPSQRVTPQSTSIYYAEEDKKAHGVRWPVPQGGPSGFFTTWNALASVIVTILLLVTIPWMRIWPTTQKVAAFTIVPIAIAIMATNVCTTILSQMMFAFNAKIERGDGESPEHKDKKLALSVDFVKKMLKYNFIWHIAILVFAVVIGLTITFIPAPSTLLGQSAVFFMSFVYFVVFVMAWFLTPVEVDMGDGTPPKSVIGWEKVKYIYRDPPKWYFTIVFPILAILVLIIGVFALYGALHPVGFQGF